MRRKQEMAELTLRIPAEGWKELAALLRSLLGGAGGEEAVRGGEVNEGFREEVFRERIVQEERGAAGGEQAAPDARYRAEATLREAAFGVEQVQVPRREEDEAAAEQTEWAGEDLSRRWERDSRRYDSGFFLQ